MYICAYAIVFYKLAVIGVENGLCLVVPVAMSTSALLYLWEKEEEHLKGTDLVKLKKN